MIKLPVDDEDDVQYSRFIMLVFLRTAEIESALEDLIDPLEGSPLLVDDARCQHITVSGYAAGQLDVATGCIASLKQMMVQESGDQIHLKANPFGAYALVRNALDAAAVAMWLLDPHDGALRIKRRLMLGVDEVNKTDSFRRTMNQPSTKARRLAQVQEVAEIAALAGWNPLEKSNGLPTTTEMLKDLERLHPNAGLLMLSALESLYPNAGQMLSALERSHPQAPLPWLGAWQLASGHAHGKRWAQLASHGLEEVEGTRTGTSSHFQMSIRYGMFAAILSEALQLLEVAAARYVKLSGGQLA